YDRVADLRQAAVGLGDLQAAVADEVGARAFLEGKLKPALVARRARSEPRQELASMSLRESIPVLIARDLRVGAHGDERLEIARAEPAGDEPSGFEEDFAHPAMLRSIQSRAR